MNKTENYPINHFSPVPVFPTVLHVRWTSIKWNLLNTKTERLCYSHGSKNLIQTEKLLTRIERNPKITYII